MVEVQITPADQICENDSLYSDCVVFFLPLQRTCDYYRFFVTLIICPELIKSLGKDNFFKRARTVHDLFIFDLRMVNRMITMAAWIDLDFL